MSSDAYYFFRFALFFLALFASAELLYRLGRVKAEYSRKYVHVGSGLICFALPYCFNSHWWVLALSIAFLGLLATSFRFPGLLPSINAIGRFTTGSLLYPVAVYISFLAYVSFSRYEYFYVPMAIMAFADPVAALIGKRWGKRKFTVLGDQKSYLGSVAFFITAFLIVLLLKMLVFHSVSVLPDMSIPDTIGLLLRFFAIALLATFAEAVGVKGTDNLTIPVTVILALVVIQKLDPAYLL